MPVLHFDADHAQAALPPPPPPAVVVLANLPDQGTNNLALASSAFTGLGLEAKARAVTYNVSLDTVSKYVSPDGWLLSDHPSLQPSVTINFYISKNCFYRQIVLTINLIWCTY